MRRSAAALLRVGVAKVYRVDARPLAELQTSLRGDERPVFVSERQLQSGAVTLEALAASGRGVVVAERLLAGLISPSGSPSAPGLSLGTGERVLALGTGEAEETGLQLASRAFPLKDAFAGLVDPCGVIRAPELPKGNREGRELLPAEEQLLAAARALDVAALGALALPATVDCRDAVHGATPLHLVAVHDSPEEVAHAIDLLLAAGADVDARASNGSTPLHWAAGQGLTATVEVLLRVGGADPSIQSYTWGRQVFGKDSGQTPLHWASASGHEEVVALLAAEDVRSLGAADERGLTAREVAVKELRSGTESMLEALEAEPYVFVRVEAEAEATAVLGGARS